MKKIGLVVAACLFATASLASAEALKVDAKLPKYKAAAGVSGNLNSIGSDTLNNLMTYWAEGFKKKYPNVNIQIEGNNAIVRGLCYGYVELFRNVPVLLQLLVWYLVLTEMLPNPDEPMSLGGLVFLSKGGLSYPVPVWGLGQGLALQAAWTLVLIGLGPERAQSALRNGLANWQKRDKRGTEGERAEGAGRRHRRTPELGR